ncbi:MAG: hypothetical protein J0L84_03195 [Verrucomicrobia bacterium]|nr:hypothetical protein [Verrucomicrobiota bacterium]
MARNYVTLGRVRGEGAWEMIFCPASGYEIQAPECKQWRAARKHPRYDEMVFAELSQGGIVQKMRLEPDLDAPAEPDQEVNPAAGAPPSDLPPPPAVPPAEDGGEPAASEEPEDTAGDPHEDFATGANPAGTRKGKPATGRRKVN